MGLWLFTKKQREAKLTKVQQKTLHLPPMPLLDPSYDKKVQGTSLDSLHQPGPVSPRVRDTVKRSYGIRNRRDDHLREE